MRPFDGASKCGPFSPSGWANHSLGLRLEFSAGVCPVAWLARPRLSQHFSNYRTTCVVDRAKKAAAFLCKGWVSFHFRAHDLRRTAASYMGEAGVDRFHIAHVLNHRSVTHNTVTAIYDRYRYDKEKRAALEKWAEVLSGIVDVEPAPTTAPAGRLAVGTPTSSRRAAGVSPVVQSSRSVARPAFCVAFTCNT